MNDILSNSASGLYTPTSNTASTPKQGVNKSFNPGKEVVSTEINSLVDMLCDQKELLKTLSKSLQECPYDKGSIVHHNRLGTCLIQKFYISESEFGSINKGCMDYKLEVLLAHSEGTTWVSLEEVLERTEMTKAIYE